MTPAAACCSTAAPMYDPVQPAALSQQLDAKQQLTSSERAWQEIGVPEGLGLAATRHKWRQNLSHVDISVWLPDSVQAKQVRNQCTAGEGWAGRAQGQMLACTLKNVFRLLERENAGFTVALTAGGVQPCCG